MPIAKKSVTVRIPNDLYDMCNKNYDSISNAVIAGLELLFVTDCNKDVITIGELKAQIEERDVEIQELVKELENYKEPEILQIQNIRIQELQDQLKVKDALQEALQERIKVTDSHQQNRIDDLKAQIQNLQDQLKIKDEQLDKRDSEIKSLTTITESQIRNPIMIEAPGAKKRSWWRFW